MLSAALMDVDEEDKGWAPTPEAKVTSTAEVFAHLWKLDQALKYSYRGKRTLRKPEEQRRLRDQMLDMWRTLQTVVDDTPFSDDEDDDGSKHPDAPPPLEEGARVEVMEAFGGVGFYATSPDELAQAVNAAMDSGKPTLINAVIDEAAGTESGRIGNLNPQSIIAKK